MHGSVQQLAERKAEAVIRLETAQTRTLLEMGRLFAAQRDVLLADHHYIEAERQIAVGHRVRQEAGVA